MRIIGGKCKGTKLQGNFQIRPTLDRVKETLFNMIQFQISDAVILDLFSGNGSLGIEALSRGASHCTFVERSKKNYGILKNNLTKTQLIEQATPVLGDAFLYKTEKYFDLIFMDPPFSYLTEHPEIPSLIDSHMERLKPGGIMIMEHPKEVDVAPEGYQHRTKTFHNTSITLIFQEEDS